MTCHICSAPEYIESLCFFCWAHVTLMGWSEQECRELEASIAEIARQHDYDRYRFGQEL
jgi:hypothetical protein